MSIDTEKKFLNPDLEGFEWAINTVDVLGVFDENLMFNVTKQLTYASKLNNESELTIMINSPGGVCTDLFGIIDTMNLLPNPIKTVCVGQAASCGAVLLSAGEKGKRFITENSRVLIHQVLGGAIGTNSDVQIQAKEIDRINTQILSILAKNCGKKVDDIKELTAKGDVILTAQEAVDFGICDAIVTTDMCKKPKKKSNLKEELEEKSKKIETKELDFTQMNFEVKSYEEDDNYYYITGIASTPQKDLVDDIVLPESLIKSINEMGLPKFVHQHKLKDIPLGSVQRVWQQREDLNGEVVVNTYVKTIMPKDSYSEPIYNRVKMNPPAYGGLSIGYITKDYDYNDNGSRIIKELMWFEVSLVTVAANPDCKITEVKGYENIESINDIRSAEKFLISNGINKKNAVALISIIKSIVKGEHGKRKEQGDAAENNVDDSILKATNTLSEMIANLKGA